MKCLPRNNAHFLKVTRTWRNNAQGAEFPRLDKNLQRKRMSEGVFMKKTKWLFTLVVMVLAMAAHADKKSNALAEAGRNTTTLSRNSKVCVESNIFKEDMK